MADQFDFVKIIVEKQIQMDGKHRFKKFMCAKI